MSTETVDAVVIGAGPNGLTAAAALADAGWDVLVLEEQPQPGGAVRSAELHPGFRTDLFSAFYPLGAVSPAFAALDLESHGLSWSRSPNSFGHPLGPEDEDAVVVARRAEDTAADLERRCAGDGEAWMTLVEQWNTVRGSLLKLLLSPFPPVRGSTSLLRALGPAESLRFARMLALPVRRLSEELFDGEAARLLLLREAAAGARKHVILVTDGPLERDREVAGPAADVEDARARGARVVLRSKTPELVRQEFWGLLLAHFAVRGLMHEAALQADEDPDSDPDDERL